MSDLAISALPAQSPVASSDVLPLVEGGATKKATVVDVVKGGGAILKDGTVPFTGDQSLGGKSLINVNSISQAAEPNNTTSAIDWTVGAAQKKTANANSTITFPAAPAAFTAVQLRVIGDGTQRTWTWPGSVTWVVGSAPVIAATAGVVTLIGFWYDGTTYWGYASGPSTGDAADETTLHKSAGIFSILANGVGNAQLRQGAGCTIVGRSVNSTGNLADISLANNDEVLMRTSNVVTSGKIANPNVATGAGITGDKIVPTFGAQIVSSTSAFSFGSSPASAGAFRMGNTDALVGRTTLGVNVSIATVTSGDTLGIGDTNAPTVVTGSGSTTLRVGASNILQALASTVRLLTPSLSFDSSAVAPSIIQSTDVSATVTCDDTLCVAQSGSGSGGVVQAGSWGVLGGSATGSSGTRFGGASYLQGGTGASGDGYAELRSPAGTQRVRANSTGLGLYATTPVAQAARVGQLTDSSGGTPGSTVTAAPGAYSQSDEANFRATMAAKINALELVIHNFGASA